MFDHFRGSERALAVTFVNINSRDTAGKSADTSAISLRMFRLIARCGTTKLASKA
jgi:hypothetical protein